MIQTIHQTNTIHIEPLNQENESFHDDLKQIFDINTQVGWGFFNSRSMKKRAFTEPCPYLVAKINGAVAGYIISEKEENEAYIPYIATSPDFQGQGVGKQLLLSAIEKAREEGLTGMHFDYRGSKEHLKKFYETTIPSAAGCTVTAKDVGTYRDGDPKIHVNYEL